MVTGKFNNGIVFTSAILLILLAMIVIGCSGTETTPVSPGPSNATATGLPGPVNGPENNTVQTSTVINNSTRPWIGYDAAADSVRSFIDDQAAVISWECMGGNYFHPAYVMSREGDIFLVNKSDRDGADRVVAEINAVLDFNNYDRRPPVIKAVATLGNGIEELGERITEHMEYLKNTNKLQDRRKHNSKVEILETVKQNIMYMIESKVGDVSMDEILILFSLQIFLMPALNLY
jgi:hypothetical protein